MTQKIIEIVIQPDGSTKLTTRGFSGTSCRDASRELERALGLVQADTPTAEMHQQISDVQQQKLQQ